MEAQVSGLVENEIVIVEGQKTLNENTKLAIVGEY